MHVVWDCELEAKNSSNCTVVGIILFYSIVVGLSVKYEGHMKMEGTYSIALYP